MGRWKKIAKLPEDIAIDWMNDFSNIGPSTKHSSGVTGQR